MSMMLSIQARFKFCKYQVRAVLPNLLLAKVTRYTVSKEVVYVLFIRDIHWF